MIIDVNLIYGNWPFRPLKYGSFQEMKKGLSSYGIDYGCVSSVPAILYRNCERGDRELLGEISRFKDTMLYIATINPAYIGWKKDFEHARQNNAAGIRIYPNYHNYSFADTGLNNLMKLCNEHSLPVFLTVGIEDARQRHHLDTAPDITGAQVRAIVRAHPENSIIVTNAQHDLIVEVMFGLPVEQWSKIYFDTTWIWGAPACLLEKLIGQIGSERFLYGSHCCFRIPNVSKIRIEMLNIAESEKDALLYKNALHLFPHFHNLQG